MGKPECSAKNQNFSLLNGLVWIYDAMQAWSRTKIHGIGSQDQYLRSTDMSATDVIQPEFLLQLLIQKSHRRMLAGMSRRGDTRDWELILATGVAT